MHKSSGENVLLGQLDSALCKEMPTVQMTLFEMLHMACDADSSILLTIKHGKKQQYINRTPFHFYN